VSVSLIYKVTRAKIDAVELDATISEQHGADVEATEHPVERGAAVTDHVRPKPRTLSIEGLLTNTPLRVDEKTATRTTSIGTVTDRADAIKGVTGRAEEAFARLERLRDAGTIFTVATRHRTYPNVIITSLSVPRDAKTGDAIRFSIAMREIRIVESQFVEVAVLQERKASKKKDVSKQTAKPADAATRRKTIAKSLLEGVEKLSKTGEALMGK
jgi:hypothetical protein